MAAQIAHDVVKEAQSMAGPSPIDDPATSISTPAGNGETPPERTNVLSKPSTAQHTTTTNATSSEAADGEISRSLEHADGEGTSTKLDSTGHVQPNTSRNYIQAQLINGDSGEQSASEDANSQNALGETSGGSDTDISRPGSVDPLKERPGGHFRSNSMKKPASFKSVSVTKNFLAKSAVSAPVVRAGEKAVPAGQTTASALQTAKPRLVAKSGSGNVSRTLSKVNGAGAGPDGSKVWNKNQPVPPPPPKQFTDEELKQQYGIHLATRLQADEAGKEAKWADIDDDEDDWAPEAVQWMDGTKSSLAAAENQTPSPSPPEDPKPVPTKETPAPTTVTVESAAPTPTPAPVPAAPPTTSQRPSSTGGTKTILKPGAHGQAGSKAGLVLKGQPEKPTLVAKPSGSAPVKSPWATLPPVDKVSPVMINPPAPQQAAPRFTHRDSYGYDAPPPPAPAKEIAPDDFNRAWRDERGNRELFNSHNGRYEPVNDTRRGPNRDNFRHQPAVLQRPHDGPAEPSAAFQTSRSSADAPAWGRRRNSSNVSGGSGRRMSLDRMPPMVANMPRRGSQSINGVEPLGTPRQTFPTVPEQHPAAVQKPSPNLSVAQPASPYGSVSSGAKADGAGHGGPVPAVAPAPIAEDPVEVQNRLMREKLERARLQKLKEREEEQKEEDARKERLRKKVEAMGFTDDAKTKAKPQSPSPSNSLSLSHSSSRPADKSPVKEHAAPVAVQSPPKPPVPTSEGEVAQYGMMKVHQPHPVRRQQQHHQQQQQQSDAPVSKALSRSSAAGEATPKPSASSPPPAKAFGEGQQKSAPAASFLTSPPQPAFHARDVNRNQRLPFEQSHAPAQQSEEPGPVRAGAASASASASSSSLKTAQPPVAAWSNNNLTPQPQSRPWGANVWGPPQAKDRALGNGTFDSEYVRGQRPGPQQLSPQPTTAPAPSLALSSLLKPSPPQPQVPSPAAPFTQPILSQPTTMPAPKITAAPPKPGPIAPPLAKGWGNFHAAIRNDDRAVVTKARQATERLGEAYRPEMRETYKDSQGKAQTSLYQQVGGNNGDGNTDVTQAPTDTPQVHDDTSKSSINATPAPTTVRRDPNAPRAPAPHHKLAAQKATQQSSGQSAPHQPAGQSAPHLQSAGQASRSSRFFPRAAEPAVESSSTLGNAADSPPPPETESHPAFAGDAVRPVVKMPRPSPRVKLPPAAVEAHAPTPDAPVSMPSRQHPGLGARPLYLDPEWQARFNSLLDKPTPGHPLIPDSRPVAAAEPTALTVTASSKAPLEDRASVGSATVSLPRNTFTDDSSSEVTTRVSAEEALLEDREFGSLPIVKLPKVSHLAANEPPAPFPSTRPNSRFYRPLEVQSKPIFNGLDGEQTADSALVKVRVGSLKEPVTKAVPMRRDNRKGNNNGNKGPKRGFTPSNGSPNSSDTRPQRKSNYPRQNSNSNSASRPSGSSAWGSNRSTPGQNNSSSVWNRRNGTGPAAAAASAH